MNLLCGLIIPVQLFPLWLKVVAYATPFPWLMQGPIDLVSGQATGWAAAGTVAAQVGWSAALLLLGRLVQRRATAKLVVQGG
jgi:ABC-2 type transport system permease protein